MTRELDSDCQPVIHSATTSDTSNAVEAVLLELIRRMQPYQRLAKALALNCHVLGTATIAILLFAQWAHADEPSASVEDGKTTWPPKFYAFCVGLPETEQPNIPSQARMLHELGFDGAGYPLWLDQNLDHNLQTLDEAGLDVYLLYASINLKPETPAYDPRLPQAIRKLKGRPITVCVLMQGLPPGDPRGDQPAVKGLRQLGDVAAEAGVRISIYHHTNDWTESLFHALRIVEKTNHPRVGANFNLCHWLMVDGDKDYEAVFRQHAGKIFAVTINGATLGTKKWTGGLIQPLDRGDFDNRRLLDVLRKVGYAGPVGLMCYGIPGAAREHLQRSLDVWRAWHAKSPVPD